ncbi:MAG: SUMF1/EgtB/PvdO family nonheme iron enzyme [Leptolyngbyaceae cyanobacterium bins.349]|nr:SUMF1/EgtB/PvdO family nonheme iron enzyme [Leptolyngbyaceae cyanobacterium bins.349]
MRDSSSQTLIGDSLACDREQLRQWLEQCRQTTLSLFSGIDHDTLCCQAHPDFSPIGWHLGHIAYTEGLWILEHLAGMSPQFPAYRRLFAADTLPKRDRVNLPTFADIQAYLDTIRTQVFAYLRTAPLAQQERLWLWLLQHESQHSETIAIVLALQGKGADWAKSCTPQVVPTASSTHPLIPAPTTSPPPPPSMIFIPAGSFNMGNETAIALDNERPVHLVEVADYWIDQAPVSCGAYRQFMQAGGYHEPHWWSEAGWAWVQSSAVSQPLYWSAAADGDQRPVCGVNWYEAEAYANYVGKRLPTEAEWEKAIQSDRRVAQSGIVWEWTNSWFMGYPHFTPYPYRGYSQAYFDHHHRVLRGGSWATQPWSLRPTFRNWYHPHVREIFAGFRCASR